jgi:hypothetical protein
MEPRQSMISQNPVQDSGKPILGGNVPGEVNRELGTRKHIRHDSGAAPVEGPESANYKSRRPVAGKSVRDPAPFQQNKQWKAGKRPTKRQDKRQKRNLPEVDKPVQRSGDLPSPGCPVPESGASTPAPTRGAGADGGAGGQRRNSDRNRRAHEQRDRNRRETDEQRLHRKTIGRANYGETFTREQIDNFNGWVFDEADKLSLMSCRHCLSISKFLCECRLSHTPVRAPVVAQQPEVPAAQKANQGTTPSDKPADDVVVARPATLLLAILYTPDWHQKSDAFSKAVFPDVPKGEPLREHTYFKHPKGYKPDKVILPGDKDCMVRPALARNIVVEPRHVNGYGKVVSTREAVLTRAPTFWNRWRGKESSKFDFNAVINHKLGALPAHKHSDREEKAGCQIPDSRVDVELLLHLRLKMHVSYSSRALKIEHAHKLANKWVDLKSAAMKSEYLKDVGMLNDVLVTIQKAVDQEDNSFLYQEESQTHSRWPAGTSRSMRFSD